MSDVTVDGAVRFPAAGHSRTRPLTPLPTAPLQVLLLATATASTVWWQFSLLPGQLVGGGPGRSPLALADMLAAIAALAGTFTWREARRRPALHPLGLSLPGLLVIGLAAAGTIRAPNPLLAAGVTVHLAVLWLVYITLANGVLAPATLATAIAAGLVVQAPLTIEQVLRQTTWPLHLLLAWPSDYTPGLTGASVLLADGGVRWLRAYGPFYHPNILGGYLALELLLLIGITGVRWRRYTGRLPRWLCGLPAGLLLVCLALAASRGAWLGVVMGLLALVLGYLRSDGTLQRFPLADRPSLVGATVLATVTLAMGLLLFRPPLLERFNPQSNRLERQSVQERLFYDQLGLQLLAAHPLLGIGAGNVDPAEAMYFHGAYTSSPVHNVPLLMAVELGPAGALAWAVAACCILWHTWRRPGWWTVMFGAALVVAGTAGLFDHYFWSFPTARTTMAVLAGAWAAALRAERRMRSL